MKTAKFLEIWVSWHPKNATWQRRDKSGSTNVESSRTKFVTDALGTRDVNESRSRQVSKKFSGSRKKFLDPKFALEQMWALNCLRTETRCLCSLPAVDARRFSSRLPWPLATLLVSDYPSHFAPYPCCRLSTWRLWSDHHRLPPS